MTKNLYGEPFAKPPGATEVTREKPGLVEPTFKPAAKNKSVSNVGENYYTPLPKTSFQEFAPQDLAETLAVSVMPRSVLDAVAEGKDFNYYAPYLIFTIKWVNRVAGAKTAVTGFFNGIKQKFENAFFKMKWAINVRRWSWKKPSDFETLSQVPPIYGFNWAQRSKTDGPRADLERLVKCCDQYGLFCFPSNEETLKSWDAFFKAATWDEGFNQYADYAEKLSQLPEPLQQKLPEIPSITNEPNAKNIRATGPDVDEVVSCLTSLTELLDKSLADFYDHFEGEKHMLQGGWVHHKKELDGIPGITYVPPRVCHEFSRKLYNKASEAARKKAKTEGRHWDYRADTQKYLEENPGFKKEYFLEAQKTWNEDVINFFKSCK